MTTAKSSDGIVGPLLRGLAIVLLLAGVIVLMLGIRPPAEFVLVFAVFVAVLYAVASTFFRND